MKSDSSEWDGEGPFKCVVSVDGSWAHVGYCARNGFVSVISIDTGKVLDYVTLSMNVKDVNSGNVREKQTQENSFHGLLNMRNTKEEPQHQYCPEDESSWCKWQTDKVLGISSYRPLKNPLIPVLVEMPKPVFEKLSSLQLLKGTEKCVTQNQNESLHHVIWSYLPKGEYHSPSEKQLGVALAVGHFNEGMNNYNSKLFDEMNLKIEKNNKLL
ncbi:unnamed protein product [Mytilus coruscus]|uniref:Uncharacterized protein n=1 Tax=Mytilus coruscus TaxID=42192 RepID=A0A6J8D7Y1_MYTCO|nr:unnamed protein product [Mytilus coruscus]